MENGLFSSSANRGNTLSMKRNLLFLLWLIFSLPFVIGSLAYAKNEGKAEIVEGKLTVSGSCTEDLVIVLYRKDSRAKESVYTSGGKCINKKYAYQDDLQEWNLPETEYYISVTGKESRKEFIRNLVMYKRPEVKGLTTIGSTEPDKVEQDTYWKALDDIKNYILAIEERLGFANSDLEASDQPSSVKLSAQGIFVLMQEGTQNLLGLVDSAKEILMAPAVNLMSPIPNGDDTDLISPLVTPVPSLTPSPSPTIQPTIVPTASGSAVLKL